LAKRFCFGRLALTIIEKPSAEKPSAPDLILDKRHAPGHSIREENMMPPIEIRARASADPVLKSALDELDRELRAKLGQQYVHLILFGSRARGDHQADSDADVAVVLRGDIGNPWTVKQQVIEITYPILVETGLYIQPWPIGQAELDAPDRSSNPNLIENILRDGISV
jgi:hypothetical protein